MLAELVKFCSSCVHRHLRLYSVSSETELSMNFQDAARVLGLEKPGHPLESELAYFTMVENGLPVKSLERIAGAVAPKSRTFKYRIVPKATLARTAKTKRLNAAQSAIVSRVASVWTEAERIWKSDDAARRFLDSPHMLLGDRKPIDLVLDSEVGAELVKGILGRLENGSAL